MAAVFGSLSAVSVENADLVDEGPEREPRLLVGAVTRPPRGRSTLTFGSPVDRAWLVSLVRASNVLWTRMAPQRVAGPLDRHDCRWGAGRRADRRPRPLRSRESSDAGFSETPSLPANDHDRAVGMAHDPLGDAAHQRPPYAAAPPAAHHYQVSPYVLGQGDDLLGCPPEP